MFHHNSNEFLGRFVTVDQWIYGNTLETKEQSRQWTSPCESKPKKAKVRMSGNKVMAAVFLEGFLCRADGSILRRFEAKATAFGDATAKLQEFGYEWLPHIAYTPDLVPCDNFLFQNIKKWLRG